MTTAVATTLLFFNFFFAIATCFTACIAFATLSFFGDFYTAFLTVHKFGLLSTKGLISLGLRLLVNLFICILKLYYIYESDVNISI